MVTFAFTKNHYLRHLPLAHLLVMSYHQFLSSLILLYRRGEEWYRIRQALAPKMMRPKVLEENIDNFNSVTKDTIERLAKIKGTSGQDGEIPDLEGELSKWATEST